MLFGEVIVIQGCLSESLLGAVGWDTSRLSSWGIKVRGRGWEVNPWHVRDAGHCSAVSQLSLKLVITERLWVVR